MGERMNDQRGRRTINGKIVAGRIDEIGVVLLGEPDSKTAEVAEVQPSRSTGDLFFSQEGQKRRHRVIGGTNQGM